MAILKDGVIYTLGDFISKIVPFLLLPYLSRKLGTDGFGELSYYQTFLALFLIFIGLSQDGAITRYFYIYGRNSLNLVINAGYIYATISAILILFFCWVIRSEILFYTVLCTLFQVFISVQLSLKQCQKKVVLYSMIQFCVTVISTLLTILFLEIYELKLVEKRILSVFIGNFIVFIIVYFFVYSREIKFKKFSLNKYKSAFYFIFSFGLPLIFHHVSFFIKWEFDKILIYHHFSNEQLGLYAMGMQLTNIYVFLILAINKALTPYLFEGLKLARIGLNDIHRWFWYSFIIIPVMFLIILIFPEQGYLLFIGESFRGVKYYILIFTFSTSFIVPYLFLSNYLFFYGKSKQISLCSIFSTAFYLISLNILVYVDIKYIPYAGLLSNIIILPMIYLMTWRKRIIEK